MWCVRFQKYRYVKHIQAVWDKSCEQIRMVAFMVEHGTDDQIEGK